MSAASVLQLFRSSTSRCVCLLTPRILATLTPTPTPRMISTRPNNRKKTAYPPKKKRPGKQERKCLNAKPADTKLSDVNIIESRKVYGGGSKQKAITIATSRFTLASKEGAWEECRIEDVVTASRYGPADHVKNKIMCQGYFIEIDATPLLGKFTADDLLAGC